MISFHSRLPHALYQGTFPRNKEGAVDRPLIRVGKGNASCRTQFVNPNAGASGNDASAKSLQLSKPVLLPRQS
jgi:hypothetical protein